MLRRQFLSFAAAASVTRPNFLFVLVDDLRFDEQRCTGHPFAATPNADRLAREGALFRNAFAVTPLCSPSRASFLTGQYPHTNGIVDNTDRSALSHRLITWPRLLHDAGYRTGFVGKWHMGNDDSPRPGFDHWVSFPGQGESVNPVLNVNGRASRADGYITDVLTDRAVEFLEDRRGGPFCLYLAHKAIHPNIQQANDGSIAHGGRAADFIFAGRHRNLYAGRVPPRRPNYARPPRNKPALEQSIPGVEPLSAATVTGDATILNRMRMTKAIDEGLGRMIASLDKRRLLDDTVVVFTSDHGYFYGEHCLGPERRLAYEETIRIPLLVRYPRLFRRGVRRDDMALSIDIAPAMLALAGVAAPPGLEGRPLLDNTARDAFLIEYYSDTVFPRIRKMGYRAVRTNRWKYIRYLEIEGADELYDLARDPFELDNLAPAGGAPLEEMRQRMNALAPRGSA
jgi:N-acetylglucosamine-6-sulfatase